MERKRLTQRFPWLWPLRKWQKCFCFYLKMKLDGCKYATAQNTHPLPVVLFTSTCPLYNRETGFPMVYQENKAFNLKLVAQKLDGLILRPGESFSFWNCVKHADRHTRYKEGLAEINGVLTTQYGGGLCQMSNLLCWLFLHTPLTLTERHGHRKKDFPEPPSDAPLGVDAAVSEGWLDLRVRNDTQLTLQICIDFDEEHIIGTIRANRDPGRRWQVVNQNLTYVQMPEGIFEEVDVVQQARDVKTEGLLAEHVAYRNRCRIGYPLPEGTKIEKGTQK